MQISSLIILLVKGLLYVYGERTVGRWIAEVRYWWEIQADKKAKILAELEYKRLNQGWKNYIRDRANHSSDTDSSSGT